MIRLMMPSTVRTLLHLTHSPTQLPCIWPLVQRVRRTALHIARSLSSSSSSPSSSSLPRKPDLLVIELSALLHDVLDKKYVSPALSSSPYSFFLPFFTSIRDEYGVDLIEDGRAREIARIVSNVSWSTEKRLREEGLLGEGELGEWYGRCVELWCVQDADRLDAIGAFGVSRFFTSKHSCLLTVYHYTRDYALCSIQLLRKPVRPYPPPPPLSHSPH